MIQQTYFNQMQVNGVLLIDDWLPVRLAGCLDELKGLDREKLNLKQVLNPLLHFCMMYVLWLEIEHLFENP